MGKGKGETEEARVHHVENACSVPGITRMGAPSRP